MAELQGLIKFIGNLDGFSFYKMNGKIIMRRPGGFDGGRIRKEAQYARVRENASEFGRCSKFGGKLRRALQPFVKELHDPILHGRMAKMLHCIMKLDEESVKGERSVTKGLQHPESGTVLRSFLWNATDGERCRYSFAERRLFFDHLPEGGAKAEVTLRFVDPDEAEHDLKFVDMVLEVAMPCWELVIPEDERFASLEEDWLAFALVRFFDGDGRLMAGKTAVVLG